MGTHLLATSYPLLDAFWTILWIVGFGVWLYLAVVVFGDIIRSHDLSGFSKALWTLVIVIFPLLGVLAYLLVRGDKIHERVVRAAQVQDAAAKAYIRDAAEGSGVANQLSLLAKLRDQGVLTQEEFDTQKAKLLG